MEFKEFVKYHGKMRFSVVVNTLLSLSSVTTPVLIVVLREDFIL